MDPDRLLREAGAHWRAGHSAPLSMPEFPAAPEETPARVVRSTGRALAPIAVALVVIAVMAVVARPWRSAPPGGPTGPTPSASAPMPAGSDAAAPVCAGGQLTASVGLAGPAGGTENVFIVLRNTSARTCRLGGILPLSGVRADGTTAPLGFTGSTDPAVADPGPVTGPGPVAPGGYGAFHVTVGLHCAPPAETFRALRIGLGGGQYVDMPYPAEFGLGCPVYEAPAGPVASPDALAGH